MLTEFTETDVVSRSQQWFAKCCPQQQQASLRKWKVRFVNDFIHMLVLFTEPIKSSSRERRSCNLPSKVFLPNAVPVISLGRSLLPFYRYVSSLCVVIHEEGGELGADARVRSGRARSWRSTCTSLRHRSTPNSRPVSGDASRLYSVQARSNRTVSGNQSIAHTNILAILRILPALSIIPAPPPPKKSPKPPELDPPYPRLP